MQPKKSFFFFPFLLSLHNYAYLTEVGSNVYVIRITYAMYVLEVMQGMSHRERAVRVRCSVVQCGAVWCSVLQCAAVCCSVLQCAAVWVEGMYATYGMYATGLTNNTNGISTKGKMPPIISCTQLLKHAWNAWVGVMYGM